MAEAATRYYEVETCATQLYVSEKQAGSVIAHAVTCRNKLDKSCYS